MLVHVLGENILKILPKILLPVLLFTSIGLFISTVYTYESSIEALKASSTSSQKMAIANALVELKAGVDFNVLNAISLSQTGILQPYLSGNPIMFKAYEESVNERIVNMRNTYYYVMLGIISPDGKMLAHTEKELIGTNFNDRPFFKKALQGKVAIGAPYLYEGDVVYSVASPVYDNKTNAILGVVFNVSRLTDTMSERMLLGDYGYIFVADKAGTVFIHKDESKVLKGSLFEYDWWYEIVRLEKGNLSFTYEGREKVAYFDILSEANWIAVAVKDIKELSAPGEKIRRSSIAIAIAILIILTMTISSYIKYILEALLKAVQYAEQVAKGVLDKDLDLGSSNESFLDLFVGSSKNKSFSTAPKDKNDDDAQVVHNLSEFKRNDEIGDLYEALQTMVKSMRDMVEKADESSRMKSEFLANMSHEIRTPLNAVIGLAHLCLNSDEDEDKKRDYIKKIEMAGKSLLGIINNVLDTSKIEAGMVELENLHFSLQAVCEQALIIYQDSAESKNLKLDFTIESSMNGFYVGDPVRIGQILNNFVGNAIKFTEKGGVNIACCACDDLVKDMDIPENTVPVCIKISDTGIGISKEQEKLLFKAFAQADTSITRRFGGTGLGLVISKHLVELMSGKLFVESEVGKGTTFTILLFLQPTSETGVETEILEEGDINIDLSGKHILVVEDNMINQLIMEELLQKTNAKVSMADNGQIAVDMADKKQYDLILMDMQMPVMDGIQATGVIRKKYSAEVLPILAVTANAMKEDKERGIKMGLNDYLTKPIDPPNLMRALKYWLDKKDL